MYRTYLHAVPFKKFTNKLLGTLPGFVLHNPPAEAEIKRFKFSVYRLDIYDIYFFTYNLKRFVFGKCKTLILLKV